MDNILKTKLRIVTEFKRHFEVYGYKKTSVDEVAKCLRMSKKTIYSYFNSKKEILGYIVHTESEAIDAQIQDIIRKQSTDRKKIESLIHLICSENRGWAKKSHSVKTMHKVEIVRSAFKKAFYKNLKDQLDDGKHRNVFQFHNSDVTLDFIEGIISKAENRIKLNPDIGIESDLNFAVYRLLR